MKHPSRIHVFSRLRARRRALRESVIGVTRAVCAVCGTLLFWMPALLFSTPGNAPPLASQETSRPSRSVWAGEYTEEQAERGKVAYGEHCATCHGGDLMGGEAPLMGPAFTAAWDGLSVGDLFRRIRTTMPPEAPGKLTTAQYVDIVSFLLQSHQFPAGKTELPIGEATLKQIRLEWTKPSKRLD